MMMAASRVSRKTMKNIGTENTTGMVDAGQESIWARSRGDTTLCYLIWPGVI
jgi:hypothetical protein